jgi:hypothetical protein
MFYNVNYNVAMSHVSRKSYRSESRITECQIELALQQRKWKTVDIAISKADLIENFDFLNDAVVLRSSQEDIPLMTTTGIFGPIRPYGKVALTPRQGTGVLVESKDVKEPTLIEELKKLFKQTTAPDKTCAHTVMAKWVSTKTGGVIPGLGSESNVFGSTGSLFINQSDVNFPVLDVTHKNYEKTLAYYGGKLLQPNESFCMGFDMLLFGMQYDTSLPDYIRNYVLHPYGGGGLFVEHHPFPHVFQPQPDENDQVFCESKIILERKSETYTKQQPSYTFTIFRIPSDGSAIAIKSGAIHNDSYTNGKQTVFLANTPANTVALRETSPFKNIFLSDVEG